MDMTRLLPPKGLFALSPISLLLLGSTMAAAQSVGNDDTLEEVIVRSSPLLSGADEIVLGTTVLDRQDILQNLNGTIGETLSSMPGVSSTFFGPGASRPIIRGLGGDRIRVLTNDISAFDVSTASQDHLVATEVATAQQIEILRGASTLRYGQNAVGGVVNVYDNRIPRIAPEDGLDAEIFAGYSTVDDGYTVGGSADVSATDNLVFHIEASDRDSDEYDIDGFASEAAEEEGVKDTVENSQSEATSGAAGLSWIGDRGYIGFAVGYQEGTYGLPGGKKKEEEEEEEELELFAEEGEEEEEEGPITIDFEQIRYDLDGEYNFGNGLVKLAKFRFGYADYEHTEFAGDEPETKYDNDEWELRAEAFMNEFELGAGSVTGTFGVNLADREFSADGEEAFVPLNDQFRWGVFGLGRYELDMFHFEASLRVDDQQNETDNLAFAGESYDESETTYSAALTGIYHLSDTTSMGVNLARSERAPTAEELFSNGFHAATSTVEIGDTNLDTEVAYSLELSLKSSYEALNYGVNIFYTDYSDFIFLSPTGDLFEEGDPFPADEGFPVFAYQQADAEFYGFEAEADFLAFSNDTWAVSIDGQVDMVRAQTTESTTFGGIENVRDEFTPLGTSGITVEEGDLPFIPPMRVLGGVDIDYKPWRSTLRVEVQYVDDQDRVGETPEGSEVELAGTTPTDSYTFLNMYLTTQPFANAQNVTLSLRGRNLTDEFARSATSFLAQSAPLPGRDIRFGINVAF